MAMAEMTLHKEVKSVDQLCGEPPEGNDETLETAPCIIDNNDMQKAMKDDKIEAEAASLEKDMVSIEDLKACSVLDIAKDKFRSRQLQRSIVRGGTEVSQWIFDKAEPYFMELVRDQYGNYLTQKNSRGCEFRPV